VVTASFGTSGTIYACAEKPVIDPRGEIGAFCDSTNRWLPLLCTMNVTTATEMVRKDFGWTHDKFAAEASGAPAGSGGLMLLPYLEGERTPNVPHGTGVWFGANQKTFAASCFARAAMEGATMGMNYGLQRLRQLGVKPSQIRVTGGGAKSRVWRQIMADIFDAEVVTIKVSEGAAYGAALQAMWCWHLQRGEKVGINEITVKFVQLNRSETARPDKARVKLYREWQSIQDELSTALRPVFTKHRRFAAAFS
jgi:xylulokinase